VFFINMNNDNNIIEQAGAELCQAHVKLGLASLTVTRKKLRSYLLQVTIHLKRN
jgi:hypothetical protein